MGRWLSSLSAGLVLAIGFLAGGGLTGGVGALVFWAWSRLVEAPHVAELVRAATDRANDAAAIRAQAAADAAETAERARQQRIAQDALDAWRRAADARGAALEAARDKLDREIAEHEQAVDAQRQAGTGGRLCTVTDADFDWLRGTSGAGAEGAAGGG